MNHITGFRKLITRGTLGAALALTFCIVLQAAEKVVVRPPEKTPRRILLTIPGDPARTQAVTWRTEAAAADPQAQIAPLTPGPKPQDSAVTVKASATTVELPGGKSAAQYAVRFGDLKPATRYNYRVGDGTTWSEWNVFRTAAARPEPFRFLYVGDAQNDIHSLWSRAIRMAYSTAPDARFIVHAGDLVADGYDDRLWDQWSDALGFISAMVPSLAVPGNHDLHRPPGSAAPANPLTAPAPWKGNFVFPGNGPEGLEGQSYYVDYQGVRLIALDVNVYAAKQDSDFRKALAARQTAWLEKALSGNPNRWTIVVQHQPVYNISRERSAPAMQAVLVPLFDKYHVDLVLAGHDHAYGRTHALRGGKVAAPGTSGTIYAVSVSGPKMYELTPANPALLEKSLKDSQLFQVIAIDGGRLSYQAYTIDGTVVDKFELRKNQTAATGGR
jgi:3',5'-cyclic AMP phosphodiesterase CpdA